MSSRITAFAVLMGGALLLAACAAARPSYDEASQGSARVVGLRNVRAWADSLDHWEFQFDANEKAPAMLALSGGGAEGAYGAGFLNGWSDSKTRPTFRVVTGTSVGALMAPLAFLGSGYDQMLRDVFMDGEIQNLLRVDGLNAIFGSGAFKTEPLRRLVERFTDASMLAAIAAEHRKGRLLFVVTTNIDAQRAVVWNMTAIASSGQPASLDLFRRVLMASASIPGVFAPMLIDVEAGTSKYAEMHVDGGITSNVLVVPEALLLNRLKVNPAIRPRLYVIVNGKLAPDFDLVEGNTLAIVSRSFWTAVKANTRHTLIATHSFASRNKWEFRATAIEKGHAIATSTFNFDRTYLRDLFSYGYDRGRSGSAWQSSVSRL